MKMSVTTIYCTTLLSLASATVIFTGCTRSSVPTHVEEEGKENPGELAVQNLQRAVDLVDLTIANYFDPTTFEMRRFYNPFTQVKSDERASVWMYTAGIEAVNAVLSGLNQAKEAGESKLYDSHYERYVQLLDDLYANADYYLGTFELVSYTQTKSWSVYAVDRVNQKGQANVTGILNV